MENTHCTFILYKKNLIQFHYHPKQRSLRTCPKPSVQPARKWFLFRFFHYISRNARQNLQVFHSFLYRKMRCYSVLRSKHLRITIVFLPQESCNEEREGLHLAYSKHRHSDNRLPFIGMTVFFIFSKDFSKDSQKLHEAKQV